MPPELVALWLGLTVYSAGFIAEIVRASIEGVPKGQSEAAASLGLDPRLALFLVVLPQALRIMIPPLTSQYLNLIKSSSLGAAVAYPEMVQIFAGTVLNQSGRAIEVMLIVMGVFLCHQPARLGGDELVQRQGCAGGALSRGGSDPARATAARRHAGRLTGAPAGCAATCSPRSAARC